MKNEALYELNKEKREEMIHRFKLSIKQGILEISMCDDAIAGLQTKKAELQKQIAEATLTIEEYKL